MTHPLIDLEIKIQPAFEAVEEIVHLSSKISKPPNLVPLCASIPADLLTPSAAYLKVSTKVKSDYSFLFESATTSETIGRYSFIGAGPRKVIETGPDHGREIDPLPILEEELSKYRVASIPSLKLPPLNGAIGYVSYDCVRYFEPKTARTDMKDVLHLPESLFMLYDTIIAFDHFFQIMKVITYMHLPPSCSSKDELKAAYDSACDIIQSTISLLRSPDTPLPEQGPITPNQPFTSNIGQEGYENHVKTLKTHINAGDIIQCVPSQRFARPTSLHPFNIYRTLRTLNPSPYLFYISCKTFYIIGASPELLIKTDGNVPLPSSDPTNSTSEKPLLRPRIISHPIAGTVARGPDPITDAKLAAVLLGSLKDRAEHVMLVDLARNDLNRVCSPLTVSVDRLMHVERFSHVQHLVSEVSGVLRPEASRFDAFRSVFPAGTVSGAPKVRAMELIANLEREKRGVYAGAVGYWGIDSVQLLKKSTAIDPIAQGSKDDIEVEEIHASGPMDTCIALRTMVFKDGVAYLQAGGGIVLDSDPYDEWVETINKLAANKRCIDLAEEIFQP
ncbi:MAG: hypothetical protein M1834_002870 [Cirrosporium novae-zelandiae]|nr:MAG: hypothetical protein M1834_002870 [Cirrosporium novae-zelandiae]